MLPLRDRNPSGITPYVVYALIGLNVAVFFGELSLTEAALTRLFFSAGVVPARVTAALQGHTDILGALVVPGLTSMFLHGGWGHLLGNMWFLAIFGDNVEARLGHMKFLFFYLACGFAAAAAQYALNPYSKVPMIGASGAIAGTLGAYAVCWPHARVLTLVFFFYFLHFVEMPALIVLGMWFLAQLLQGAASLGVPFAHGGVAYWAHVGGFVAGAILVKLLPRSRTAPRPDWRGPWGWQ